MKSETNKEKTSESKEDIRYGPILMGPSLNSKAFLSPDLTCFDGCHFNQKGYSLAAREIFPAIEKYAVSIEFKSFKKML